jgi:hypothetical protein
MKNIGHDTRFPRFELSTPRIKAYSVNGTPTRPVYMFVDKPLLHAARYAVV